MERAARLSDVCHRWHVITAEHHIQHIFHTAIGSRKNSQRKLFMSFFISGSQTLVKKCPHIGNKVVCQAEGEAESDRTDMVEILEKTCNCFQSFACASVSKLNQLKTPICVLRPIRGTVEDEETTTKLTLDTFQSSSKSGKADKTTQLVRCCWLLVAQLLCSSKHVNMKSMCRS